MLSCHFSESKTTINLRIFCRPFMNNASRLFRVSFDFRGLQYLWTRFACSHRVSFHQFCCSLADCLDRVIRYNPNPSSRDDYLYSTISHPFKEGDHEETPKAASLLLPVSSSRKRFPEWRVGMMACAVAAMISLLLNVGVIIGIAIKFGMPNGIGTLFHGSCKKVESFNFWIHLGINALSTILLGGLKLILVTDQVTIALIKNTGSNYCMQCLSAPTRKEVDAAHAKGKWLDIGVPSVRNLTNIAKLRVVMWLSLGLTSLPLHLMWVDIQT